jgi:hypothetical protein
MKKITLIIAALLMVILPSLKTQAQTDAGTNVLTMGIPAIALLATTTNAIDLQLTTAVPGEAISGGEGTAYVQISSIVATGLTRKITASVDNIPAGTTLNVSASIPSNGNFGGTVGTGSALVDLTTTAADIVTGIGSCYTGVSGNDGYKLDYKWNAGSPANYGNIIETSSFNATVTLTITEDN